jgi:2-polyprenyl-6-methoxyphenol hydroxylase-like FAD-dependent oxidoreductase
VSDTYDVIVVGARCAGSPTAMLLARRGYRVLVVDRAAFPSDTISTHLIHPPGVAALKRWGLLDPLIAAGTPPIHTYAFDMGPFVLTGKPGFDDAPVSYAPRRTVLDKLLIDAAAAAGAEVREAFTVDEVVHDGGRVTGIRGHGYGGETVTETARVVVGADGLHSVVARAVAPEQYREKPRLLAAYYTYWSDFPMDGRFEAYDRPGVGFAAWPTNDGLTLVIAGWPHAEFQSRKKDVERNYLDVIRRADSIAQRLPDARREDRFFGAAVPNFFRKPFGPGWALVGDAGYNKDFITAQGISDAFLDAELCATALHAWVSEAAEFDAALAAYQAARDDRVSAMYEFTCNYATLTPPPPEVEQLFAACHGNQEAMDGFARVVAGVTSPAEFFSEQNVARIMGARAAVGGEAPLAH